MAGRPEGGLGAEDSAGRSGHCPVKREKKERIQSVLVQSASILGMVLTSILLLLLVNVRCPDDSACRPPPDRYSQSKGPLV